MTEFHDLLYAARKKRALTQAGLAKITGFSPAAISHFESGTRKPSFDSLRRLSAGLHITADYLLGRTMDIEGHARPDSTFSDMFGNLTQSQREVVLDIIKILTVRNQKPGVSRETVENLIWSEKNQF